jgi:hypothetical protein
MDWVEQMIEECEATIRRGLDHTLHNAPGRVAAAEEALSRLISGTRRLNSIRAGLRPPPPHNVQLKDGDTKLPPRHDKY